MIALTLLLAGYLTRQAAASAARHDLSAQADILAAQQRSSVCPLCPGRLNSLSATLTP
ncbi:MAG: hypothetical protein QOE29_1356, partial [Gaiellaceae bacterium]|nr:hypothetical protein [Gaiellaceae bacterium]